MKAAEAGSALLAAPPSAANPEAETVVWSRARKMGAGQMEGRIGNIIYQADVSGRQ